MFSETFCRGILLLQFVSPEVCGFLSPATRGNTNKILKGPLASQLGSESSASQEAVVDSISNTIEADIRFLKGELLSFSERTNRGFKANGADRKRVGEIVNQLEKLNPTAEPAKGYYASNDRQSNQDGNGPSLSGKWTLIYTDAPDITSLDNSSPFASLGRIGQECEPPYIRNVIEWNQPSWLPSNIPLLSGSNAIDGKNNRVLQRVVTKGSASPDRPMVVDLEIAGFQVGDKNGNSDDTPLEAVRNLPRAVQTDGVVAGWYKTFPIDVQGPLSAPFGQFTILYLDEELRVVRTGQGYIAANLRTGSEWI